MRRPVYLALLALILGGGAVLAQTRPTTAPATAPTTASATAPASQAATQTADLTLTQAEDGKTLHLGVNKTLAISLSGNATTGYSWALTKMEGTSLEQAGEIQYLAAGAQRAVAGGGGTFVARFKAVKEGQSIITLGYARPWENGTPPTRTFTVTIVVDKAP